MPCATTRSQLACGTREVPDAVCDDEIARGAGDGNRLHSRENQLEPISESFLPRARRGSREHRPRQIDAGDAPAELGDWHGIASGTASEVECPADAVSAPFLFREPHENIVGRRSDETGDGVGGAPRRSRERIRHQLPPRLETEPIMTVLLQLITPGRVLSCIC